MQFLAFLMLMDISIHARVVRNDESIIGFRYGDHGRVLSIRLQTILRWRSDVRVAEVTRELFRRTSVKKNVVAIAFL